MSLTVRDRFRLFFKGAVLELALIAKLKAEHRAYRDALNNLVQTLVEHEAASPGRLYVMVDSETLVRIVRGVYGPEHPWSLKLVALRRQFPGLEERQRRVN